MKKYLLNIFIIINVIFSCNSYSYSEDNFSLYGVTIGESYDEVKQNGIERGYEIIEPSSLDENYLERALSKFLNKDLYEKISKISPLDTKRKISYSDVVYNYFKENVFLICYRDNKKSISLDIYCIKDFNELNVFAIIAKANVKSIIDTFNKRYGNYEIKEYKSNSWGGNEKFYIWTNKDIVALADFDLYSFILADTSQVDEMFSAIYNDYVMDNREAELKEKEYQKKRDEEI